MCKSDESQVFFAGVDKIFSEGASLCRPGPRAHPGIIRARPGIVKNFLVAIVHNFLGCKSAAPIIVQLRSDCQVLFAQLHKINRLTSLCGCAKIRQMGANLGQPRANFGRLRQKMS